MTVSEIKFKTSNLSRYSNPFEKWRAYFASHHDADGCARILWR